MNTPQRLRWSLFLLACLLLAAVSIAAAQDQPAAESPATNWRETEPNNDFASADNLHQLGDVTAGRLAAFGDVDYFKVSTEYGRHLLFDLDVPAGSSLSWPSICIYDVSFVEIACNTDGDLTYEPLLFTSSHGGMLYVSVEEWGGGGGPGYDYRLTVYSPLFVSATTGGVVAGVPFAAGDVLAHYDFPDGTERWQMFFDASDVGIAGNLSSLALHLDGEAWLVFTGNPTVTLSDGRRVTLTPYHLAFFEVAHPGPITAGRFGGALDFRQDGFTTAGEKLDALTINGSVALVSTTGTADTPWGRLQDEDVLELLDGSTVPGLAAEDVIAAEWDWHADVIYLTILGSGVIDGQRYTQKDIFRVGHQSHQVLGRYWNGPEHHFNYNLDAFELGWDER